MAPILAFAPFVRLPLLIDQIHAEDVKAIETAVLALWSPHRRQRPDRLWVMSPDTIPLVRLSNPVWGGKRKRGLSIPEDLRANLTARNATPPKLSRLGLDPKFLPIASDRELKDRRFWDSPERQSVWLYLPGFSKDRRRALVHFTYAWSPSNIGRATVLLAKKAGRWQVSDSISYAFPK